MGRWSQGLLYDVIMEHAESRGNPLCATRDDPTGPLINTAFHPQHSLVAVHVSYVASGRAYSRSLVGLRTNSVEVMAGDFARNDRQTRSSRRSSSLLQGYDCGFNAWHRRSSPSSHGGVSRQTVDELTQHVNQNNRRASNFNTR